MVEGDLLKEFEENGRKDCYRTDGIDAIDVINVPPWFEFGTHLQLISIPVTMGRTDQPWLH